MDARAIRKWAKLLLRGLSFVVRCPTTSARAIQGLFARKIMVDKAWAGTCGLVVSAGHGILVSDYDLMLRAGARPVALRSVRLPLLGPVAKNVACCVDQAHTTGFFHHVFGFSCS